MSYLLRCKNCGYDISSSDRLASAKNYAESISSCSQCHSKKFEIVDQGKKEVNVLAEKDKQHRDSDQSSLDNFDHTE
jgi:Zn finger protein HypA/HybF involved in hydrogenase expression